MTALTIFIDGNAYASKHELHQALKMLLDLPEHYGCNADALYDCLSERTGTPVNLCILTPGEGDVREGSASTTGRLCVIGSKINEEKLSELFR